MFVTQRPDGTKCIKVDFDLQKLTEPRSSSEHHPACVLDVGPDVRALGAVLQVLLDGGPSVDVAARCARQPYALDDVIRRCLEEEPPARFASVAELARELAPFGTPAARSSCERIECLLEDRVRELTGPTLRPELRRESSPSAPSLRRRPCDAHASGKVVFLALAMLAVLGAGAFASMYVSVYRGGSRGIGVAEMQPSTPETVRVQRADRPVPAHASRDERTR
jgi:hypothetical protein